MGLPRRWLPTIKASLIAAVSQPDHDTYPAADLRRLTHESHHLHHRSAYAAVDPGARQPVADAEAAKWRLPLRLRERRLVLHPVARCPGGSSQIVPRNVSLRMDFERQQFLLPLSD